MSETGQKENHQFATDNAKLLKLMIHSLYSNKEIFLRELVSNAADAADKLRFNALSHADLYEGDADLRVRVSCDKENNTLTISDNGIGMTHDQIVDHLGTIAKSGTAEFFSQLSGDQASDSQLIGQFGVGFYSAFIVADSVTVRSRAAGVDASEGVEWTSAGEGEFTTAKISKTNRGTDIILHLKAEEKEYADDWRLKSIVTKYSDHISVSVEMLTPAVPVVEAVAEVKDDEGNVTVPAAEAVAEVPAIWEPVNKATALWTREKSEISDDEYKEFYKHVSHDFGDPLVWEHNKVEGKTEYTSLLYIPSKAPFDMHNREKQHGLKLFVQRVFIMDDAEQFMPTYLRFVKGLLDSNDLPLNVSREILQDNKITQAIRKGCTKRVLKMLEKLGKKDKEQYQSFWNEFGQVLKEGPAEDQGNKEQVANLLRFASTESDTAVQSVSIPEYVERMKEGQEKIYYVVADSFEAAKNSPHLEVFRKKGIEVLLMSDRIDEWLVSHLTEVDGKQLQSVTRGGLDLGDMDDEETKQAQEKLEKEFDSVVTRIKKSLEGKVKDVKLSQRLTDSPACIVADEHDMSSQMMKLMQSVGQEVPDALPIFEINAEHELVKHVADETDDEKFNQWTEVLFEQAMLAERGSLKDPASFVARLNKLMLSLTK
ncbi:MULTISPECIES: molecular chaperone HtpG [unclassified Colwellia]|uniref:molecular chaperone HtpG n=1 Tax=unclassified Colwellia TaxID=196834 RepID=UPI0015F6F07D|nr:MULTISPECIES: molecular chaperone HtpG [unclassified Colwellia]MBA6233002.1 molecular chaperone HtpG [Colwellia sp. MB02u-7]MBA6236679.1 molecular chaperone HtpG [Colwellia sp. MB02u-11]MBA6255871.1 molecular chaperone HtpG [Colwellia sp. MB3u-28]MBA6262013.1 molecular chaperone HtpG [Colwellia sp. MB3u-41]MBA6298982.1 molecular chaperone HtpG [Colwellia sp. MB3u-22]